MSSLPPEISRELFMEWRAPRLGTTNPERLTNRVWAWIARDPEMNAWMANKHAGGPSSMGAGPCWCNNRFGQSRTELADGRVISLAGEHEDYYDPDFFIYNDAIVEAPGGELEIYGYPRDIFPPTDFHTATVVADRIILVGSLGYAGQRGTETQLLALDTRTLAMSRLEATGESPGWLYKHTAELDAGSIVVRGGIRDGADDLVENVDDYALALDSMTWTRLTARKWTIWRVERADNRHGNLWRIRSFVTYPWTDEARRVAEIAEIGFEPDRDQYAARYTPPVEHASAAREDDDYNIVRIAVDGVIVRYTESDATTIVIEGELPERVVSAIIEDARAKLATITREPYVSRRVR
ncbi:MAG TPA: hypothetical protein VGG28_27455 [Kofleriaceae bacterium]|jgi:hypothetical protein